jgi:hypothetical protein
LGAGNNVNNGKSIDVCNIMDINKSREGNNGDFENLGLKFLNKYTKLKDVGLRNTTALIFFRYGIPRLWGKLRPTWRKLFLLQVTPVWIADFIVGLVTVW